MRYANVKNAHIVPASYLRAWEAYGRLTVRVGNDSPLDLAASKVGTRRYAYRRQRPSGEQISDVEWTLSDCESKAAPLLGKLAELWPLGPEEKSRLAVFIGFQIVRGPRWVTWHDALREVRESPTTDTPASTARLLRMLKIGAHMGSLVGTMHWSLLEFGSPLLATSDQPVVIWPRGMRARQPQQTPFDLMDVSCSEIRLPTSPRLALLMTWTDEPDDEAPRLKCRREHAASLNAFTVAQADKQWFHQPGRVPPRASGTLLPLAPQLMGDYDLNHRAGIRRKAALKAFKSLEKEPLQRGFGVPMYRLTRASGREADES